MQPPSPSSRPVGPRMHCLATPSVRMKIATAVVSVLVLSSSAARAAEPAPRTWTVGADKREALVVIPDAAKSAPAPLVFVFHGHGGTARHAAATINIHKHWPEAVVVYPQGLNTPGQLTDKEGKKSGWQAAPGLQDDRDLKFFDAMLESLRKDLKIDDARIHSTGHSNGGGFTYLLWAKRGDVLASVAPSAAVAPRVVADLKPKPVLHLASEGDELVKYAWQQRMLEAVRKLNGCEPEGKPDGKSLTEYPSKTGTPVVVFLHDGGHKFPADGPAAIAKFLKAHPKPAGK